MGWKLIRKEMAVKATRRLVSEFSSMEACPRDRPLNARRLEGIQRVIAAGQFRSPHWASCFCKQTRKTYRVNGKHTSTAMASLNGTLPDIDVLVSRYECDTLDDLAALYSTFDSRLSTRTSGDIYLVYAAACPGLDGVSREAIALSVAGLAFAEWEVEYTRQHSPEERAALLADNVPFVLFLSDTISAHEGDSRPLRRGPTAAAMAKTFARSREGARAFWTLVRTGAHKDRDNPTRVLERYLIQASVNTGAGSRTNRDKRFVASNREMYVRCLHAWNAWARGEHTALRYTVNAETPKLVIPTPEVLAEFTSLTTKPATTKASKGASGSNGHAPSSNGNGAGRGARKPTAAVA